MSSTVISTQVYSTAFLNAPQKVDPYNPSAPASISNRGVIKKEIINASNNSSFGFGNVVELNLPNKEGQHLVDVAMELSLGTLTSGNWCNYPVIASITDVQLLDGEDILMQYNYRQVMKYVLAHRNGIERESLLANAGGTSFASGKCIAPIPLFFSKWIAKFVQKMPFFASHKLANPLLLRITLDQAANLAANGATVGTPTISGEFHVLSAYKVSGATDPDANWNTYQSYDFESKLGTVVATGAATTDVNLNTFKGNIESLMLCNELVTDLTTAHDYFKSKPIDTCILKVGSDLTWYKANCALDFDYDALALGSSAGNNSVLGDPLFIPFGVEDDPRAFTGAFNNRANEDLIASVSQSQGSNTQTQITAIKNAYFKVEGGRLKKYLSG